VAVEHEQGDVVPGGGAAYQVPHYRRARVFSQRHGRVAVAGVGGHQLVQGRGDAADPAVDRLVAAFDEAVGEAAQERAGRDDGGRGPARGSSAVPIGGSGSTDSILAGRPSRVASTGGGGLPRRT
jgi:hypothetical protein